MCLHCVLIEGTFSHYSACSRQAVKFMLLTQDYPKMVTSLNVDVCHNNHNYGFCQQQPLIFPGVRGMLIPRQHLLPVVPPPPVPLPS